MTGDRTPDSPRIVPFRGDYYTLTPEAGALVNGLVGIRMFSRRTAGLVACTAMGAALALSLVAFWQLLGLPAELCATGSVRSTREAPGFAHRLGQLVGVKIVAGVVGGSALGVRAD